MGGSSAEEVGGKLPLDAVHQVIVHTVRDQDGGADYRDHEEHSPGDICYHPPHHAAGGGESLAREVLVVDRGRVMLEREYRVVDEHERRAHDDDRYDC